LLRLAIYYTVAHALATGAQVHGRGKNRRSPCKRSRHKADSQLLLILALLCATLAIISFSGFADLLTHFRQLQALIQHSGPLGWTLYVALFIVATLCLIPGSLLVMVGGVVFGPVWGTLLSLCAATVASALVFAGPLAGSRSAAEICRTYRHLSGD
jgi:uncharacterized membrane protein YdjX (TVP38/TMEM64 family)